ncbi:hypothetical protein [Halolamina sp. C58]|uniref:hypothetical protein n=1 Tax=Halolamina sp. C58 TaxID=3421640 RepID=UPI003EBA126F
MRDAIKKKVLMNLLESEAASGLTTVIAEIENELLVAAEPVDAAMGTGIIGEIPDVERRKEAIQDILKAIATDSVRDVWTEQYLPVLVDNPEKAENHVGKDAETWEAQIEAWAEAWRENGAEGSDRELAEIHVREVFGVDLDTFETRVVEFDSSEEAERLFASNFRAVRDVLDAAAEEVGK